MDKENTTRRNCSVCGIMFDSEDGLVSCEAHSFGERQTEETETGETEST